MSAVLETREPSARYLAEVQPALVRQFELLATAPGGVARLRELILALAVQGNVVQQDPGDEPASELLRRIRSERTALVAAGLIKQEKPSAPISPEEEPCPLPRGWAWVRFGDLIHELCTGPFGSLIHKEDYVSGGVPLINPSHMIDGRIEHDTGVSVSALKASQLAAYQLSAGDVLLARRGEMGRYALVTEREAGWLCGTGSFFLKLSEAYDRRFFGLTLEDPRLRRHLLGESVGATMTNLNQRILLDAVIAVAPLAEQARIVARVDELMRLCDALEAKCRLESEQHARLLATLLGTLTDSSAPEELAANWQRVADHFDLLLDRPEAVDALEQTIQQLAVRGLLVPRGVWTKSRLGDVVAMLNGYAFKSEWFIPSGVRLVRNVNVSHGSIDWHQAACVSAAVSEEFAQFALAEGDVVLTLDRPIISTGLKLAVVEADDLPCLLLQRVARLSPDPNVLSRDFMLLWLRSDSFMKAIDPGRSNGVPHISTKHVAALTIDLPRLPEQACIVARVEELRRLCADLRQRLAASQTTQSHLAEALVDMAVT